MSDKRVRVKCVKRIFDSKKKEKKRILIHFSPRIKSFETELFFCIKNGKLIYHSFSDKVRLGYFLQIL